MPIVKPSYIENYLYKKAYDNKVIIVLIEKVHVQQAGKVSNLPRIIGHKGQT